LSAVPFKYQPVRWPTSFPSESAGAILLPSLKKMRETQAATASACIAFYPELAAFAALLLTLLWQLFEDASEDPTPYRLLTSDYVSVAQGPDGKDFVKVYVCVCPIRIQPAGVVLEFQLQHVEYTIDRCCQPSIPNLLAYDVSFSVWQVDPEALTLLSRQAMVDVAHLLRPAHLQQLSNILKDKEASENDKFVALEVDAMHVHACV